jgi:cobalt-zinc-cadmium resistance protein CzcA
VKVFGEEFEPMLRAAGQIAAILRGLPGAADVRVEQATGLPFLEIGVDKAEIARRGLSLAAVQDLIGAAVGGREAGVVFEGDRRFDVVVRLPESIRADLDALRNVPVPLPQSAGRAGMASIPLKEVASFTQGEGPNQISRENGKRRVVVTAAATSPRWSPRRKPGRRSRCGCRPAIGSPGAASSRTWRSRASA